MPVDVRDVLILIAWFIGAVSASTVMVLLGQGIIKNHLESGFRPLLSAMFLVAITEAWNSWAKTFLRLNFITGGSTVKLLTDNASIAVTWSLALSWAAFATVMMVNGRKVKKKITKDRFMA